MELHAQELQAAVVNENQAGEFKEHLALGQLLLGKLELVTARSHFSDALALALAADDEALIAEANTNLSILQVKTNELGLAKQHLAAAVGGGSHFCDVSVLDRPHSRGAGLTGRG